MVLVVSGLAQNMDKTHLSVTERGQIAVEAGVWIR
jgi:hypothetical protein